MDQKKYDFRVGDSLMEFEFYSEGPRGRVKKMVIFTPWQTNGMTLFNLAFGDWDEEKNALDDLAITNNNDKDKILATVAATVLEFTNQFPHAFVYAKGSTPARTRLYQIGIVTNWNEISRFMDVYGYTSNKIWQVFQKNVDYEAFLVLRKKL
jgi:hypothetical protein